MCFAVIVIKNWTKGLYQTNEVQEKDERNALKENNVWEQFKINIKPNDHHHHFPSPMILMTITNAFVSVFLSACTKEKLRNILLDIISVRSTENPIWIISSKNALIDI